MILSKIFTLFWAIALAGCVAAMPLDPRQVFAQRMTLGYRTVSPDLAKLYNAKGRIVFDPAKVKGAQIGVGVYTTPGPAEWVGNPGDWYCLITARKSTVHKLPKLWIPAEYWWLIGSGRDTTPLINYAERTLPSGNDLDYSLVLSEIADYPGLKQLMIPTYLISGHGLDMKVECKANPAELRDNKRVDYSKWPNTYGRPQ